METIDLNVNGMTCGSCVASVTRALQSVPGVATVAVDLPSGAAHVATSGDVTIATLTDALAAAGYEASAFGAQSPVAAGTRAGSMTTQGGGGCCCR